MERTAEVPKIVRKNPSMTNFFCLTARSIILILNVNVRAAIMLACSFKRGEITDWDFVFFVSLTVCVTLFQGDNPDDAGTLRPLPVVPTRLSRDPSSSNTFQMSSTVFDSAPSPAISSNHA